MNKYKIIWYALLLVIIAGSLAAITYIRASGTNYQIGTEGAIDSILNTTGSKLWVSFGKDNYISEINTQTMTEIRRITVPAPTFMVLSPDETYLYVIVCGNNHKIRRINLSNESVDQIELEGLAFNLTINQAGTKIWVVSSTWPAPYEPVGPMDAKHQTGTGRITEIDLDNFSISNVIQTYYPIPISVWYSPYSDKLFVIHQDEDMIPNGPTEADWIFGDLLVSYNLQTYQATEITRVGKIDFMKFPAAQMTSWDDQMRFLAVPDPAQGLPKRSLLVFDTLDNSLVHELSFPTPHSDNILGQIPIGIRFCHKVPGQPYLWAITYNGLHDEDCTGLTVIKINTDTLDLEYYCLTETTRQVGDFAVSQDGNTLYIPIIMTGEVIVWSPD
ncbi:MAG TPA: hypothetical protein VGB30_12800 [bacterium]|jgi:hypothetical protein